MHGREIIFSLACSYPPKKKISLLEYGDSGTCAISNSTASIIDKEVKKLVDDCYTDAKRILTENMDVLHSCANLLLEKERISREEFEALFKNDKAAEENL